MPGMSVDRVGYGAGTSERAIPNLLRVAVGEADDTVAAPAAEQVAVIETNIDDMNLQMYDYLLEKISAMGVLDVFLTPLQMKKNRPGTLLTVVCPPDLVNACFDFLLTETTSIGLRWRLDHQIRARSRTREARTRWGAVKVRVVEGGPGQAQILPDYEDCKRLALEKDLPLREVMQEAWSVCSKERSSL